MKEFTYQTKRTMRAFSFSFKKIRAQYYFEEFSYSSLFVAVPSNQCFPQFSSSAASYSYPF